LIQRLSTILPKYSKICFSFSSFNTSKKTKKQDTPMPK
jgi:hypothetical protein